MTCREKLKLEHPEYVIKDYTSDKEYRSISGLGSRYAGGCKGCPSTYGYMADPDWCDGTSSGCAECWDRKIPGTDRLKTEVAKDLSSCFESDGIRSAISDILRIAAGGTGYIKIGLEKGKITNIYTKLEKEF